MSNESYGGEFDPLEGLSDGAAAHLCGPPWQERPGEGSTFPPYPRWPMGVCAVGLCTESGPCVSLPWRLWLRWVGWRGQMEWESMLKHSASPIFAISEVWSRLRLRVKTACVSMPVLTIDVFRGQRVPDHNSFKFKSHISLQHLLLRNWVMFYSAWQIP